MSEAVELSTELTVGFSMTAAGASAQGTLPLATLVADVIQVATDHANALGVGYSRLIQDGNSWVLSRLTIEIDRLPRIHDVRTVWVAINIASRRPADLSGIAHLESTVSSRRCPIHPQGRIPVPEGGDATEYAVTFRASDIDFNRHVTTTRYVELALDALPLDLYDRAVTRRFEIAFRHEARWGEAAVVRTAPAAGEGIDYLTSVELADGSQLCAVRHSLRPATETEKVS